MKTKKNRSFDRIDAWLIATSVIASISIALIHCGSNPVCGNNVVEGTEACDKGALNGVMNSGCSADCQIAGLNIASAEIFVTHLLNEAPGYPGASCSDLGSTQQHIVLDGPMPFDKIVDCTMTSYSMNDIMPGDYKATVTLLDANGTALTNPVSSDTVTAAIGKMVNLTVNFALSDFIKQDYTGTLFFSPGWGGASTNCSMASPAVTGYGVLLKNKAGTIVSGMSTGNRKLDGTEGPCFVPGANGTAEAVAGLTWGHYDLSFIGYDNAAVSFCQTFDVFSGPGDTNATYDLTVGAANADAGACP